MDEKKTLPAGAGSHCLCKEQKYALRKGRKSFWKRAVFTVEAAYLIPMAALITLVIIGYLFYNHQRVWSSSAAYEAAFYGLGNTENEDEEPADAAGRHLEERLKDNPITAMETEGSASGSESGISVSWSIGLAGGLFDEWFKTGGTAEVKSVCPSDYLKTAWLVNYAVN